MKNIIICVASLMLTIGIHAQPSVTYQCDSVTLREIKIAFGADSTVDVSSWFEKKERITVITFSCNKDTFPSQIGMLTALKRLSIHSNQMKHLPPSIGNLTNLEQLDLSDNLLEVLPDEIGKLKNLKRLDLRRNNLHSLPDSIVHLRSIELYASINKYYCHLDKNNLCSLPDPVAQWADEFDYGWHLLQKEPCDHVVGSLFPPLRGATTGRVVTPEQNTLYTLHGTRIRNVNNTSNVNILPPGCYIVPLNDGRYQRMQVVVR